MKKVLVSMTLMAVYFTVAAQTTKPVVKKTTKPETSTGKTLATSKTSIKPGVPKNPGIKTSMDSIAYAIGVNIGGSLMQQELDKLDINLCQKGMEDVLQKKTPYIDPQVGNTLIQTYMQSLQEKLQAKSMEKVNGEKAKSAAFLEANKKRPGVITLPSGLQYEVITKGNDSTNRPAAADTVVANYAGSLINGTEFDNSYKRGEPLVIAVGGVIRGWTEILQLMHVGDKWKVYIPSELGYGDRGAGATIPGGAALIFEMELLGIKPAASK